MLSVIVTWHLPENRANIFFSWKSNPFGKRNEKFSLRCFPACSLVTRFLPYLTGSFPFLLLLYQPSNFRKLHSVAGHPLITKRKRKKSILNLIEILLQTWLTCLMIVHTAYCFHGFVEDVARLEAWKPMKKKKNSTRPQYQEKRWSHLGGKYQ